MNFVKLSTKFWSDPDVTCSFAARGLFACLLSYCMDNLTDGAVSERALLFVAVAEPSADVGALMEELARDGMVKRVDGGWLIPGYKSKQTSKAEVERKRKASAAASAKAREKAKRDRARPSKRDVARNGHVTVHAGVSDGFVPALEVEENRREAEEKLVTSPVDRAPVTAFGAFSTGAEA